MQSTPERSASHQSPANAGRRSTAGRERNHGRAGHRGPPKGFTRLLWHDHCLLWSRS